jgi:hypothetical protein
VGRARAAALADDAHRKPVSQQIVDWWTGASSETAYINLHERAPLQRQRRPTTTSDRG